MSRVTATVGAAGKAGLTIVPAHARRRARHVGYWAEGRGQAFYNACMFVHLRLHTEFSVVDGTNRIDEVVASAAADGQPALAITDFNNLFGAI